MRARKVWMAAAAAAVVAAGLTVAPLTFAAQAPANGCADIQIIGARASTERPGLGVLLTPLAQRLTRDLPQTVRTTAVDYPATLSNYQRSLGAGVDALAEEMAATTSECPDTRFVLMGYSQGANVVGDALAGRGRTGPAVPDAQAANVAAIVLFGDPTFTAGEPFNAGTGTRSGVFARGAGNFAEFADRTQSFCNRNDRFCQSGSSLAAHLNYRGSLDAAAAFVAGQVG